MLVSVCIPTYNGEKYLQECINSVYEQTYKDFEIVICDDCSTDGTVELVKSFQQKDKRIKLYVNEKNLGLVGNWNRCMELAQGGWIKFVFQDDLMTSECLQKMVLAIDNSVKFIISEREFLFENNIADDIIKAYENVPKLYHMVKGEQIQVFSAKQACGLINKNILSNFLGEPTSVMFKKSLKNEIGLFNPVVNQQCDLEYWLRIISVYGFVYLPEKLVKFRVHTASTTQKNNTEKYFTSFFADRIIVIYFLLFDKLYKTYRKKSSIAELFNTRYTLFYIIYHANLFAQKNGDTVKREMELLNKNYPKIKTMQKQYLLYVPINMLIRIFNKIIKKRP